MPKRRRPLTDSEDSDEELQPKPKRGHKRDEKPNASSPRRKKATPRPLTLLQTCQKDCEQLFPRIDHDYVAKFFRLHLGDTAAIIEAIANVDKYPRQARQEQVVDVTANATLTLETLSSAARPALPPYKSEHVVALLRTLFTTIPVGYIREQVHATPNLFPAYVALDAALTTDPVPFRVKKHSPRPFKDVDEVYAKYKSARQSFEAELNIAVEHCRTTRHEDANMQTAQEDGAMAECVVCYEDLPMNRMLHCEGDNVHSTCYGCIRNYVATLIGQAQSDLECPHGDGGKMCGAAWSPHQLGPAIGGSLVGKLEYLKQQNDIRKADLADIAECPFCDYKAIYPDVDTTPEFDCKNDECGLLTCRKCKQESHTPMSCTESAAQRRRKTADGFRHQIEEAMTVALLRNCSKCKRPFVKDWGCNFMRCSCGHTQCYLCGAALGKGYDHFRGAGACVLHDNNNARHRAEVAGAEAQTRAAINAENPDLDQEHLMVAADVVRRDNVVTDAAAAVGDNIAAVADAARGGIYAGAVNFLHRIEGAMQAVLAERAPVIPAQ